MASSGQNGRSACGGKSEIQIEKCESVSVVTKGTNVFDFAFSLGQGSMKIEVSRLK